MYEILKLAHPDPETYSKAFKVCLERWPNLDSLNQRKRFEVFQRLGVEMVIARTGDSIEGVCYLLPDTIKAAGRNLSFVWLFDFAVTERAKGVGATMFLKIMSWIPFAMAIGAAEDTENIYRLLGWKKIETVWRCVHPIRCEKMLALYADRFTETSQWMLKMMARPYEWLMPWFEKILGNGLSFKKGISDSDKSVRLRMISNYLNVFNLSGHSGSLEVVERAGVGRIVQDAFCGWMRLRAHAKLWRELRKTGMDYTEYVATSHEEKKRALWLGYLPLSMPLYIWDASGQLSPDCEELNLSDFSFASSDKIL